MKLKILIDAGEMKPSPTISQKLGPLGINLGKLIKDVNDKTLSFKGMKVPVEIEIKKDKSYDIKVFSPPTSQLIKKELGIETASGDSKKLKAGNLAIEQIIALAKIKFPNMLSQDFKAVVKSVVGTCVSLGVLIENKPPKEISKEINEGKFDNEISLQTTELSPEKKSKLQEFFNSLKLKQEELIKKEEEQAAQEAAAKAQVPQVSAQTTAPAATTKPEKTAKPEKK